MIGIALGGAVLAGALLGWPAMLAAAPWAALLVVTSPDRGRTVWPALAVVAAAGVGAWRGEPPPQVATPAWVDDASALRGQVVTAPTVSGRTQQFEIAVLEVEESTEQGWQPTSGRVCASAASLPRVEWGDRVMVAGSPEPLTDQTAAQRSYFRSRGCVATVFARFVAIEQIGGGWRRGLAALNRTIGEALQRVAPGDAGALLTGLVTGDDHRLSPARQQAFVRTGTSHLTAVSGSNVALLLTIAATLGTAGGVRRRLVWQLATLLLVWGYALLVGLGPPATRAALVATGAILAARFGRRPDYVTLILLAGALMVIVDPGQVWRLSFQLSLVASLALAVVVPGLAAAGRAGWLRATLAAPVAAEVATLPILATTFGAVSVVGLPANLLIAPLAAVAFPLAALTAGLALVSPPLAEAVGLPARLLASAMFAVVDTLGGADSALAPTGPPSRPVAVLLAATAALIVIGLSREGRIWLRRLPAAVRTAAPAVRLAALGVVLGIAVGVALGAGQ